MKKLMAIVSVGVALALSAHAVAYTSLARHGGIVQGAGDLSFELVHKNGQATIYVNDHGRKLQTTGASGKLTVLKGTQKTEVRLKPGEDNTLVSEGDAKLVSGSRAMAYIQLPGKQEVNVRFSIR